MNIIPGCWAFQSNNNLCRHSTCGHSYTYHKHLMYETEVKKTTYLSEEMQANLDTVKGKGKKEALVMKMLDDTINELKEEEKIVKEVGAQFAAFLKVFAIIPYNDAMGEYIDMQIEAEEKKIGGQIDLR